MVRRTYTKRGAHVLLTAPAAVVLHSSVPQGGTRSQISARQAGANRALATSRTLSTGCLRKAAKMISISYLRVGR